MSTRSRIAIVSAAGLMAWTFAACSQKNTAQAAAPGPTSSAEAAPAAGMAKAASHPAAAPAKAPRTSFQNFTVVDRQQGGLAVGTIAVPEGWTADSRVEWTYSNVSFPVRMSLRVAAPDGSAWLESFPSEMFYWLDPRDTSVAVGGHSLGMIHAPGIGIGDAMKHFVVSRYRGRAENLQVVGYRQIGNLAQALGKPDMPGDSLAARVRYTVNGRRIDEEFFALLTTVNRIPYHGPQGTTYESHRVLAYVFSMGAADGKLDGLHPVLGFVASSWRPDPNWVRYSQQIYQVLSHRFNEYIAQGYAQIAAAGRLSRAISANNDAMLQTMEAQRQAANTRQQERASANDSFDQYIRGTERMEDPYWGTSEHSYNNQYHWTDGQGSYQHSNDSTFDPNLNSNQNWQRMKPAK
jgi:hypothetical protein